MVATRLLQHAAGPVDQDCCQVLVQVAQHREANRRHNGAKDCHYGEVAVLAQGTHQPAAHLLALACRWLEGAGDLEHIDLDVVPDLRNGRGSNDCNEDAKIRQESAQLHDHPGCAAEACQPLGELVGECPQDELKEGSGQRLLVVKEVLDWGLNCLDNEDHADQTGEDVLTESSHVVHEGAQVEHHNDDCDHGRPHERPKVEGQELQIVPVREVVAHDRVGKDGTSSPQDRDGLAGSARVEHPASGRGQDGLYHPKGLIRVLCVEVPEGDSRHHTSEEEEEDGGNHLPHVGQAEGVNPVTRVVGKEPAFEVEDDTTERPMCPIQRARLLLLGGDRGLGL
mmetsp:Transcript_95650/g.221788  ORF Transcript_95650/g.221788 Transcript_95650/m.221788 type:complete len:339 (+) Transcript_95650:307-1323(+)